MTDYFSTQLPHWASSESGGDGMEVGAQLCTRDGRIIGNAVVVEILHEGHEKMAFIMTDCGNYSAITQGELDELFYAPKFIVRQDILERKKLAFAP